MASKKVRYLYKELQKLSLDRQKMLFLSGPRQVGKTTLPEKVGNPLSLQSLREDLDVAHDTISHWLTYLKDLCYFFEVKPWSKSVPRSLKKEGKICLYDWTEIDFLITSDKKPWLCVESKMNDTNINYKTVSRFTEYLKCPYVQVVMKPNIWQMESSHLVCCATHFF